MSETRQEFSVDQIWKAGEGRRLRVVSVQPTQIGVRNWVTGRLSYWRPEVMRRLLTLETDRRVGQ